MTFILTVSLLLLETSMPKTRTATEEFALMDPNGVGMILIAMTVVFSVLISLYLFFKLLAKLHAVDYKALLKKHIHKDTPVIKSNLPDGETLAAITLALHLYNKQMQGLEDLKITFKNNSKSYSPWNSKLYGLRLWPKK